ncbi:MULTISPECIES: hypothetical protein [Bacillus]|uniref:hypothetical protein n=1 Tax=Bacillus TaxID=1386 RepID=UPI001132503F|nr:MULTISPECIES: hypothetical protein [Bacillus]
MNTTIPTLFVEYLKDALKPVASDTSWEDARLMAGVGDHLYIVRGEDLIRMRESDLRPDLHFPGQSGWRNATLLAGTG